MDDLRSLFAIAIYALGLFLFLAKRRSRRHILFLFINILLGGYMLVQEKYLSLITLFLGLFCLQYISSREFSDLLSCSEIQKTPDQKKYSFVMFSMLALFTAFLYYRIGSYSLFVRSVSNETFMVLFIFVVAAYSFVTRRSIWK